MNIFSSVLRTFIFLAVAVKYSIKNKCDDAVVMQYIATILKTTFFL